MQIDPQTAPQQSIYKLLIGCVGPRPIAWVSSLSPGQRSQSGTVQFLHGRVQ
jgi:hypothetical protein